MRKLLLFVIILLILVGCSTNALLEKNYYILENLSHIKMDKLHQTEPIDASVLIFDASIPRSYKKKQMVVRHFGPRLTYTKNHLWAVDLSETIPDILLNRLFDYNVFQSAKREFWQERPEYEILMTIHNLEQNIASNALQARLNISFILKKSETGEQVVKHEIDVEKSFFNEKFDTYIQTINQMLIEESDTFIQKILVNFGKIAPSKNIIKKEQKNTIENANISIEKGILLFPALTKTEFEEFYTIIDSNGYEIEEASKIGDEIALNKGIYSIKYGSGSKQQQMTQKNIEIIPRYKTIIEPDWGCLSVNIINTERNFVKVRYELFDNTGSTFGSLFPAETEVGEHNKIWILKPGIYKITVNNESFNAYQDFTTVKVEKGEVAELTIVMDTDENGDPTNLIGSGVLEKNLLKGTSQKMRINSAIHGNVNFNSDNENTENNRQEYSLALNGQLDNRLIYRNGMFNYTLKHLMEIGVTKEYDDDFHLATDNFDLKNTGIIYFLKDLGFYGRIDLNTHLFEKNEADSDMEEIVIEPSFFPLKLKEGFGINYRILKSSKVNLSIRGGLGFRQDFNENVLEWTDYSDGSYKYVSKETTIEKGIEFSAVGNFRLPFNLSYSVNADVHFPSQDFTEFTMEWENMFNLKLTKFVSLDYKLKLANEDGYEDILTNHSLFVRITYFLR